MRCNARPTGGGAKKGRTDGRTVLCSRNKCITARRREEKEEFLGGRMKEGSSSFLSSPLEGEIGGEPSCSLCENNILLLASSPTLLRKRKDNLARRYSEEFLEVDIAFGCRSSVDNAGQPLVTSPTAKRKVFFLPVFFVAAEEQRNQFEKPE